MAGLSELLTWELWSIVLGETTVDVESTVEAARNILWSRGEIQP